MVPELEPPTLCTWLKKSKRETTIIPTTIKILRKCFFFIESHLSCLIYVNDDTRRDLVPVSRPIFIGIFSDGITSFGDQFWSACGVCSLVDRLNSRSATNSCYSSSHYENKEGSLVINGIFTVERLKIRFGIND